MVRWLSGLIARWPIFEAPSGDVNCNFVSVKAFHQKIVLLGLIFYFSYFFQEASKDHFLCWPIFVTSSGARDGFLFLQIQVLTFFIPTLEKWYEDCSSSSLAFLYEENILAFSWIEMHLAKNDDLGCCCCKKYRWRWEEKHDFAIWCALITIIDLPLYYYILSLSGSMRLAITRLESSGAQSPRWPLPMLLML